MKGIDVSVWNGSDVDFQKVKEAGYDFVIIRAGYGSLISQKDKYFETNFKKAKAAGMLIGIYWYSYGDCTDDAIAEAKTCLEVVKGKTFDLPIYFDLEEQSQLKRGKEFCSSMVKAFCSEIEKAGCEAGLYTSRYYLQTVMDDEVKALKHLWVAEYDFKLNYDGPYEIWQKTSVAKINGVNGNCDVNESTVDFKKKEESTMSRQSAYNRMKSEVLGKSIDIDGWYGAQCWDFVAYVMQHYYGGKAIHCGLTGYVKDIANQRKTNGILNFCKDIGLKATLQPGDICVWGNCTACPDSHIAIYDHDNGQDAVYFLGQNQGARKVTVARIPVTGIIGVFRPNTIAGEGEGAAKKTAKPQTVLNQIPANFHKENATFTVTVDKIKIRQAPSLAGKDTGLTYDKGMSVNYDGYVIREGYVWISWIGSSTHTRRWMACGKANSAGKNIEPWGTFK